MEGSWYGLVDISTGLLVLICASQFSPQIKQNPKVLPWNFGLPWGQTEQHPNTYNVYVLKKTFCSLCD